ncbi:response regulator transcription factor [Synechococcus sp. FGCU-3]|nr:response regulator transcription factor [Synechococcus sp. FGCU3]
MNTEDARTAVAAMVLRCLILEDQVMFGQLLTTMLQPVRDLAVVGMARTCREGLLLCREHQPDLLILDLALPDGDGIQVARAAIQRNPACRILVLSAEVGSFVCPADLEPNVADVIDKATTYDTLTAALDHVLKEHQGGGKGATPAATCNPLSLLTARQGEVFLLIGRGLQNKEIARALGLEVNTVETHRKEIARRLEVSGSELVHLAALQVCPPPGMES